MRKAKRGFTLIEIMIVILIIAILLGLAIPNFLTARAESGKKACQHNMRALDTAKASLAMENNLPGNTPVNMPELIPYLKVEPQCPQGGNYVLGTVNDDTTCTLADHPPK